MMKQKHWETKQFIQEHRAVKLRTWVSNPEPSWPWLQPPGLYPSQGGKLSLWISVSKRNGLGEFLSFFSPKMHPPKRNKPQVLAPFRGAPLSVKDKTHCRNVTSILVTRKSHSAFFLFIESQGQREASKSFLQPKSASLGLVRYQQGSLPSFNTAVVVSVMDGT